MNADRELGVLAAGQHGVFKLTDTVTCGFTAEQRRQRLASGRWLAIHDGSYRVAGAPQTWRGDLLAACWAGGLRSAASHRSALALYDLPGGRKHVTEITTQRWLRARHPDVVAHESRDLPETDLTDVEGIPTTTPVRTIIDAAAVLHRSVLELIVDEALRRELVEFGELWQRLDEMAKPGRRGIRALRRVLACRHPDAELTQSMREHLLLAALRRAGLPDPVLQYEIRDATGQLVARVDAAYPARRIALEYDSYLHHGGRAKYVHDLARRNRVTGLLWHVVHVAGPDLRAGGIQICADVRSLLEAVA